MPAPVLELSGSTMGTSFSVKVVEPPDDADLGALADRVESSIYDVERRMSTYLPESELMRFNSSDSLDWQSVSPELCAAVAGALAIGRRTGGAFDVTIGPLVELWGFGAGARRDAPPQAAAIEAARGMAGLRHVQADCERPAIRKQLPLLQIDLSGFAKGYAVDRAAAVLDSAGIRDYLVEIGGELRASGQSARGEPWAIAVEQPQAGGRSIRAVYGLSNAAMATSGDYRNFFEYGGTRYSHTIDPRSGRPVTHAGASVTVVANLAAEADGLATALLVMGPAAGYEFAVEESIAAYFVVRDGDAYRDLATPAFAERFDARQGDPD